MQGAAASVTQTMLIRNARITSTATGNPVKLNIGRYALTDQTLWKYGTENNGTATVRNDIVGGAVPTTTVQNLAIGRVAWSKNASLNLVNNTTETTVLTLTNFIYAPTTEDTVLLFVVGIMSVECNVGGGNNTGRVRIYETNTSGVVLHEFNMTAIDGGAGKGTSASNKAGPLSISDIVAFKPTTPGWQTLVLTLKNSIIGSTTRVDFNSSKILGLAKSA